jgi:hypothetical protein
MSINPTQTNLYEHQHIQTYTVKVITTKADDDDGLFRAPATTHVSARESKKRLLKMSLSTATAIGKHGVCSFSCDMFTTYSHLKYIQHNGFEFS